MFFFKVLDTPAEKTTEKPVNPWLSSSIMHTHPTFLERLGLSEAAEEPTTSDTSDWNRSLRLHLLGYWRQLDSDSFSSGAAVTLTDVTVHESGCVITSGLNLSWWLTGTEAMPAGFCWAVLQVTEHTPNKSCLIKEEGDVVVGNQSQHHRGCLLGNDEKK